jgi:hypothetical protein
MELFVEMEEATEEFACGNNLVRVYVRWHVGSISISNTRSDVNSLSRFIAAVMQ